MATDFRRLGSDRNSIAINRATGSPTTGPISYPVTGDIGNGEIFEIVVADAETTGEVRVGHRKIGALLIGLTWQTGDGSRIQWSITDDILSLEQNNANDNTYTFWVF